MVPQPNTIPFATYRPAEGTEYEEELVVALFNKSNEKVVDGIDVEKCILVDELKRLLGSGELVVFE